MTDNNEIVKLSVLAFLNVGVSDLNFSESHLELIRFFLRFGVHFLAKWL